MAQAMASMAGLHGSSQAILEESLQLSSSSRLALLENYRVSVGWAGMTMRALQSPTKGKRVGVAQSGHRAVLGLAGSSVIKAVLAEAKGIKVGPPPPPSGGLHKSGTLNSDQPRDLDLPLKDRFNLQPLTPAAAAARAKESAKDIVNIKELIDKKQWPYVQNDLRLKASYLRFDLNTVISAKPKGEKKPLKELAGKLFATIDELDHAAKRKSVPEAEKYYGETKSALNDVLAKLG